MKQAAIFYTGVIAGFAAALFAAAAKDPRCYADELDRLNSDRIIDWP